MNERGREGRKAKSLGKQKGVSKMDSCYCETGEEEEEGEEESKKEWMAEKMKERTQNGTKIP